MLMVLPTSKSVKNPRNHLRRGDDARGLLMEIALAVRKSKTALIEFGLKGMKFAQGFFHLRQSPSLR
jgi:hypothetical protein